MALLQAFTGYSKALVLEVEVLCAGWVLDHASCLYYCGQRC